MSDENTPTRPPTIYDLTLGCSGDVDHEALQKLLESKADVEERDPFDKIPALRNAVNARLNKAARMLIEAKANVNEIDPNIDLQCNPNGNMSILALIKERCDAETLQVALAHGAVDNSFER